MQCMVLTTDPNHGTLLDQSALLKRTSRLGRTVRGTLLYLPVPRGPEVDCSEESLAICRQCGPAVLQRHLAGRAPRVSRRRHRRDRQAQPCAAAATAGCSTLAARAPALLQEVDKTAILLLKCLSVDGRGSGHFPAIRAAQACYQDLSRSTSPRLYRMRYASTFPPYPPDSNMVCQP